jgi:hypothetical protein
MHSLPLGKFEGFNMLFNVQQMRRHDLVGIHSVILFIIKTFQYEKSIACSL